MFSFRVTVLLVVAVVFGLQVVQAQEQMYDVCPLKVGQEIPAVMITNEAGVKDSLTTVIGDKPTVMVFYRGAWCGYCTQHLAELNHIKGDIEALGFQIFGVTLDQADRIGMSYEKAESEITVYSDASLEVTSAFGLDWKLDDKQYDKYKNSYKLDLEEWSGEKHHSLPVPSIYIIKDNVVQFQYVNPNYKIRLNPDTLLAVLKTM